MRAPVITAATDHECARCDRPIGAGRRMAWLADEDELVHPACLDEETEQEYVA